MRDYSTKSQSQTSGDGVLNEFELEPMPKE